MNDQEDTLLMLAVALLAVFLSGTAAAEGKALPGAANPAFANPDTPGLMAGRPAPDVVNTVDITFLQQLSLGSRAEVELGKLTGPRGAEKAVDEFGKRMVKDHEDANGRLQTLARGARVELPAELDAEHVAAKAELEKLDAKAFDIRYAEGQIKDHQKAVQLLSYEIAQGQHAGVRQFAADTLPVVMEHLEHAKALHAQLTGAGPPVPSATTPRR